MKKNIIIIALFMASAFVANAQNTAAEKEFNNTLKAYFEAKNDLAKDNAVKASESVKTLIKNIDEFPIKSLSASQQALWKTESTKLRKSAVAISDEKELKEQRKSFWTLSSAMLKLAQELKLNHKDVYVQYCPHAKKSWLSEVEAIQNPYYGSMMFACGKVTETIAKK